MKIDANIVTAIDELLSHEKITAKELSKRIGVSEPTMNKWRRPGNGILDHRWILLFKHLRPYLPSDRIYLDQSGKEQYASLYEGAPGNPYFKPKLAIPQMVPEFTVKQLKKFNPVIQTAEQYAQEVQAPRVEYRPKVTGCTGIFATNIAANMKSSIPTGATAFISTDAKPKTGGLVLVVTAKEEVMIGGYTLTNKGKFEISVSGTGPKITGSTDDIRTLFKAICPVIMYEVVVY